MNVATIILSVLPGACIVALLNLMKEEQAEDNGMEVELGGMMLQFGKCKGCTSMLYMPTPRFGSDTVVGWDSTDIVAVAVGILGIAAGMVGVITEVGLLTMKGVVASLTRVAVPPEGVHPKLGNRGIGLKRGFTNPLVVSITRFLFKSHGWRQITDTNSDTH
ncbi:hypothetical protein L2E82_46831 [Cichorium intybus]|uniref:Uncharacterized protein n=1 Tax=Cichorium intybus TaxID=13427 RepID=A0ACB8YU31_CICIN|nr:hypothetical protein L2E82_46831 [Cichorium intybus]